MKLKNTMIATALLSIICFTQRVEAVVTLPVGFSQVLIAGGITAPTTMAIVPDGRFFVAQQNGQLRVVKNDTLLSQPMLSLSVNIDGERGLLGVAIDPNFNANNYIYVCYTIASGAFNRVSRFTTSGDTIIPGSEVTIIELDSLIANYHGGGHLEFGPDGTLFIAAGENGRSYKSQELDSYLGKILRINPDGSVPINNPFPGPGKRDRVWSYGLRNPFTFSFQPGTGKMFINDVGEITYEEINDGTTGGENFGWPAAEGNSADTNFANPYFSYIHGTSSGQGCAITGGTFFNPVATNYPALYQDKYYYIDYCGNWIDMISLTNPPTRTNFASNIAAYSVGIATGIDGNLYYLSRNDEALYKIAYSVNQSPAILNHPQSQTISLNYPVTFSATASGAATLNYQWLFNNAPILGAILPDYTISNVAFTDSGDYQLVVSNTFGSDTSAIAHLNVTANQPPAALITAPLTNSFYSAGEVINFSGSANDPEDGTLATTSFQWLLVFHHDTHIHPGPTVTGGTGSGSFTIPNTGEKSANVFYRLYLIVQDSEGMIDSSYVDLLPRTSMITVNTQPAGLQIQLDGQPFTTPYSVQSVEGMYRMISAPYSQQYGANQLYFTSWNNNGTLTQTISTSINDTTFLATYDSLQLAYNLGNDSLVCVNDFVVIDAGAGYQSYAWTDGTVGQYITLPTSAADTLYAGVTVVDGSGMTGHDSVMYIVDVCNSVDQIAGTMVSVYPVPSSGKVNISKLPVSYFLNVYDMTGRVIIKNSFVPSNEIKTVDLGSGLYTFIISTSDKKFVTKKVSVIK
jgi:glucose/arabinose dehydrogenase